MRPSFTFSVQKDVKNERLKQLMVECIEKEKGHFTQLANDFYNRGDRNERHYLDLCNAIISAADGVLNASDWESSLFLRNTIKPLKSIRDHAVELREALGGDDLAAATHSTAPLAENCVRLYVSLYQSNGHDIKKWANQLDSIVRHMTGRPVYQDEEAVRKMVRAKCAQTSEAYVVVAVNQSKIISNANGKRRKDRFESVLIDLLPGALMRENILEFVHQNKRYYFHEGQLLLQNKHQE